MKAPSSPTDSQPPAVRPEGEPFRILSLDGGGSKGFYTLGVLAELEGLTKTPLCDTFDLIYGTSTGAIIASLLAIGFRVEEIHDLYATHVPSIMRQRSAMKKSAALKALADDVFGTKTFRDVRTDLGVVATRWTTERPMIFKSNIAQAHGRVGTFEPGFGVTISDAVQASCSAYPFFERKRIATSQKDAVELVDGGFCANNPTLYAIADAVKPLKIPLRDLRVVSIGVGVYPTPKEKFWLWVLRRSPFLKRTLLPVDLLQKVLEINTQSMAQLQLIACKGTIEFVRVNDTFERPEMATDFREHDLTKLNLLRQLGRDSFERAEADLTQILL